MENAHAAADTREAVGSEATQASVGVAETDPDYVEVESAAAPVETAPVTAGAAAAPTLNVTNALSNEDGAVSLEIDTTFAPGVQHLSITIAGVPAGAALSAGTDNGDGTWSLSASDLDGLTITPPANSDGDFSLTVTATGATESGVNTSSTSTLDVSVTADADTPSLTMRNAGGSEDGAITLDISSALTDTDGSESLSITIAGVPNGAALSAGTDNGDGTWTLTPAQLGGLTITPAANSDTDFTLTVTATSTEAANGDTAQTTGTIAVRVDAVADAPTLTANDVTGAEDSAIALNIIPRWFDTDGSETLSITIAGVPNGASLSAGTDNGDGAGP